MFNIQEITLASKIQIRPNTTLALHYLKTTFTQRFIQIIYRHSQQANVIKILTALLKNLLQKEKNNHYHNHFKFIKA